MDRKMIKAKVLEDLKKYPELKKKVVLLRYEQEHPAKLSDSEVIDSMALSHPLSDEIKSSGYISDKTMRIAVQFRDRKDRLNQERSPRNSTVLKVRSPSWSSTSHSWMQSKLKSSEGTTLSARPGLNSNRKCIFLLAL